MPEYMPYMRMMGSQNPCCPMMGMHPMMGMPQMAGMNPMMEMPQMGMPQMAGMNPMMEMPQMEMPQMEMPQMAGMNPMMEMPQMQMPQMMEMPQEQLEAMYPRVYHIIHPHVKHHCDMFQSKYGMNTPSREHLEAMVDDIHRKVMVDIDIEINLPREDGDRQFGFGGRRLARDLITILLLRELIGRRPHHFGGFGGFGGF